MTADSPSGLIAPDLEERLARLAPEVREVLADMHGALWRELDAELLELCRLRIAMLQGDAAELGRPAPAAALPPEKADAVRDWPASPLFDDRERACLAFTEQFAADVAGVTQADADALLAHLTPGEARAFVSALLALDQHQRLALGLRTVLAPEEEPA